MTTDDFLEQISNLQDTNRRVRQNSDRRKAEGQLAIALKESADLTEQIEGLDAEKKALLESARFPVHGLSFTDEGVLFNGLPLEQASQGEQLRVSAAIGMALNPKLKVLMIRDASLLDDEAMAILAQQAHDKGYQLWLERVGAGQEVSVVIEDGGQS
jgi:hypothetical protein